MTAERSVEMKFDGVFSELSGEEKVQFQGQVHNKLTPHLSSVVLDNYQCTEGKKRVKCYKISKLKVFGDKNAFQLDAYRSQQ